MLSAKNINKTYGDLNVLKDIDFSIEKGQIVSIVGASGAGKSTLLHILGTLDRPDSGSLLLEETDLITLKNSELSKLRNKKIGFIFQFHNLLPEFTAFENICLPGYIGKVNDDEVEKRGKALMDLLGLKSRSHHKPSELSGGEQQRTAVARALINQPAIVFADEPSGNLDSKNAEELHKLFLKLRADLGQTFVIVTHNQELANLADKKIEMLDGMLVK